MTVAAVVEENVEVDAARAEEAAAFKGALSNEVAADDVTVESKTPAVEESKEEVVPVVELVKPEPKYLTAEDEAFKSLVTKAQSVDEIKAAVDKFRGDAFGRLGGLEHKLKQLIDSTPAGQAVTVTPEDLAEITKAYPDFGKALSNDLTKVFSRFKGTAEPVAKETEAEFQKRVETAVEGRIAKERDAVREEMALGRLEDLHEDWKTVVGPKDSTTPFRKWLQTEGYVYEQKILNSDKPGEIAKAITKFKDAEKATADAAAEKEKKEKKTPASGQDARSVRLSEAIPAKGGSGPPAKREETEAEAFRSATKRR